MMRTAPPRKTPRVARPFGELAGEQLLADEHHDAEDQGGLDHVARQAAEERQGRAAARQPRAGRGEPVEVELRGGRAPRSRGTCRSCRSPSRRSRWSLAAASSPARFRMRAMPACIPTTMSAK